MNDPIPPEIRARVEANAFFDALVRGEYSLAAQSQERIQQWGFYVGILPRSKRVREALRVKH